MIANLKRNIVFIALALLAWLCYSDLDEVTSKAAAATKSPLRPIEKADLEVREPDPTWVLTRDPYGLVKAVEKQEVPASGSPRAAKPPTATNSGHASAAGSPRAAGSPGSAATTQGAVASTLHDRKHLPLAHWLDAAEELLAAATLTSPAPGSATGMLPAPVPAVELPPVQFTLVLQSTLAQADGGQARISGQTVQVGAPLAGLDTWSPPVLVSVQGSVAVVSHRGTAYVLDLDHQATVQVQAGTPGVAAATAEPRQPSGGMGGGMGGGSTSPRTRSVPSPRGGDKPAAAKPTPAAAPVGGTTKKSVYKTRSYPGKPKR